MPNIEERPPIAEQLRKIRRRVKELRLLVEKKDYEAATNAERALRDEALRIIAKNLTFDSEAVACAVLATDRIKFPRYCA